MKEQTGGGRPQMPGKKEERHARPGTGVFKIALIPIVLGFSGIAGTAAGIHGG